MITRRRMLTIAGGALALLLVAGVALLLLIQDPERYRADIAAMLGDALGQPVELSGPVSLSWRPSPSIGARDVRMDGEAVRITIDAVQVFVHPRALLARKLHARRVLVQGVRVDLEQGASQRVPLPDVAQLAVDELELRDVTVRRAGAAWFAFDGVTVREVDSASGARVDLTTRAHGHVLSARARLRVAPSQVDLDAIRVQLPAGVISGQLRLALDAAPDALAPRLSGAIESTALAWRAAEGGQDPFEAIPLYLGALVGEVFAGVDAALQVRIGRLSLSRLRINEISAPVTLLDGRLEARIAGLLASGPLRANVHASAADSRVALELEVSGADAGDVLVMAGLTSAERGGSLRLAGELQMSGADLSAWLSSAQGTLAVDAAGVTVRAGSTTRPGTDLLASLLRALQPGAPDRVTLGCASGRFAVRDGVMVAERSIGIQSRTKNLIGSGRFVMAERSGELVLQPWPRVGAGLTTTATDEPLLIVGPMSTPRIALGRDAATRDASLGHLAPLAQALLERAQGDVPCAQAAGANR